MVVYRGLLNKKGPDNSWEFGAPGYLSKKSGDKHYVYDVYQTASPRIRGWVETFEFEGPKHIRERAARWGFSVGKIKRLR